MVDFVLISQQEYNRYKRIVSNVSLSIAPEPMLTYR